MTKHNPEDRGCATCKYGDFGERRTLNGICEWPVPQCLPLPVSITRRPAALLKTEIWITDTDCPTWAAPDGVER